MFSFNQDREAVFQSGFTNLHFHRQYIRIPAVPFPSQHFSFLNFSIILVGVIICYYSMFLVLRRNELLSHEKRLEES